MTRYEITPCPVCRSTEHRVLADRDAVKRELEALWQFHLRRLKTGAPVEQLFDRAIFSQQPPLQVVQCDDCGLVFRNPREREDEIVETYQDEAPSDESLASLAEQQRKFFGPRVQRLTRLTGTAGSVLEVGSYVGGFLRAASERGWRAVGLDVNPHANAFARAHGCTVHESELEEFSTRERFTAVALWNCFDQLPDPHSALAHVRDLLEAGGLVAVRVPNGAFYARLPQRERGFARALLAWNNLSSFPYRHGFTARSLEQLLSSHGFEILDKRGDALVSIAGPYTRSWARSEERLLKTVLNAVLPFRRAPWLEIYAHLI